MRRALANPPFHADSIHRGYLVRGCGFRFVTQATLKFDIELFSFTPPPPQDVSTIKDGGVLLTKG